VEGKEVVSGYTGHDSSGRISTTGHPGRFFRPGHVTVAEVEAPDLDEVLRMISDDAEWLASLLHQLMPNEPEVAGLLTLIRLHRARSDARFDPDGVLVLLERQDVPGGTTTPSQKQPGY
jgi:hypothetical protein